MQQTIIRFAGVVVIALLGGFGWGLVSVAVLAINTTGAFRHGTDLPYWIVFSGHLITGSLFGVGFMGIALSTQRKQDQVTQPESQLR